MPDDVKQARSLRPGAALGQGSHPATTPPPSRAAALHHLLTSPDLAFIMEAHSGLSAKIVEEAGFAGIWASGLSMSASLGLRDNNEASWTQVLELLEYMADATTLPILVDGDTGYGNFNNVRRLVRKLGERGIAGVCIEDKLFPKTNSFIGEAQPLADLDEFCGRIRAGKDAQTNDAFSLVARTEALISGHSMEEALRRAEAYVRAGADAVLIHSKKSTAAEITGFMERWGARAPVVIVPTMYYATPTDVFRQAGISMIIWANHLVRSSITAMRETARSIMADESLQQVEGRITPVRDIFKLTGNDELEEASERYLPAMPTTSGIVLAASRGTAPGTALGRATVDRPKCMIDVRGKPLLRRLVATLAESNIHDVTVVRGYRKEAVLANGFTTVDNDEHATTGEAASLACAAAKLTGDTVVVYGDVLFRRYILDSLLALPDDIAIVVDATPPGRNTRSPDARDLVRASRHDTAAFFDAEPALLTAIGTVPAAEASGEWIGLMKLTAAGATAVREALDAMRADQTLSTADLPALLSRLATRHPVRIHYITGHWLDVDTMTDLADARNFS